VGVWECGKWTAICGVIREEGCVRRCGGGKKIFISQQIYSVQWVKINSPTHSLASINSIAKRVCFSLPVVYVMNL